MREVINEYIILVGRHEEKRPFERPRLMWMNNIKVCLREIMWDAVDWVHLA
jgi:hypothetical protein